MFDHLEVDFLTGIRQQSKATEFLFGRIGIIEIHGFESVLTGLVYEILICKLM
jgi:hypothetical protein